MKKQLLILSSLIISSWAGGTVSVDVTTDSYNGAYAPKHVMAVWVTDQSNKFVKSLEVDASNFVTKLTQWLSMNGTQNRVDAVSSASLLGHKTHNLTWNCTDASGNGVPDGTYRVWFEMNETNQTGPSMYSEISVGAIPSTVTPQNYSFTAISEIWNLDQYSNWIIDTVRTTADVFKDISISYKPDGGTPVTSFLQHEKSAIGVQLVGQSIAITGISGTATLQLFSASGQKIMSENLTGSTSVSIGSIPSGFYLASIRSNGVSWTQKIMIAK